MIYIIGDLHLSFGVDKPMDIFRKCMGKSYRKIRRKLEKDSKRGRQGIFSRRFFMGNET